MFNDLNLILYFTVSPYSPFNAEISDIKGNLSNRVILIYGPTSGKLHNFCIHLESILFHYDEDFNLEKQIIEIKIPRPLGTNVHFDT